MKFSRDVDSFKESISISSRNYESDVPFPSRPNQMKTRYSLIRETEYSPSQR